MTNNEGPSEGNTEANPLAWPSRDERLTVRRRGLEDPVNRKILKVLGGATIAIFVIIVLLILILGTD